MNFWEIVTFGFSDKSMRVNYVYAYVFLSLDNDQLVEQLQTLILRIVFFNAMQWFWDMIGTPNCMAMDQYL